MKISTSEERQELVDLLFDAGFSPDEKKSFLGCILQHIRSLEAESKRARDEAEQLKGEEVEIWL